MKCIEAVLSIKQTPKPKSFKALNWKGSEVRRRTRTQERKNESEKNMKEILNEIERKYE